jgi:uncharacterized protein YacL
MRLKKKTVLAAVKLVLFMLAGAGAGYAYYAFVGCATGTCPITSNPIISTVYGAIIGFLLSFVFTKPKKKKNAAGQTRT